ncbi:hypothetical protein [Cognatishimia activa]|uniref:hypothetical protein n=1 Tax=Cognatishimia activa TaxID=1715691 RepID=UPI002231ACEF|nr:hypothetical protein [Cognatishimia activa]UZD92129.1 hypothetical protein M0D42_05840 [Cognatishimia activa]
MDIDWLKASENERKQLYIATRAVADAADISVEAIMDAALGRRVLMGTDYMSTFRRGKIRRSYAKLIYQWISENHFGKAHSLAPAIFSETPEQLWQAIVDEKAHSDNLQIMSVPTEFGIARRNSQRGKVATTIRFGTLYCLEFESHEERSAILFQKVHGHWYNIEIGPRAMTSAVLKTGLNFLPQGIRGPDPLYEEEHEGVHEFVLVTSTEINFPSQIDLMVEWVRNNQCELHKTSASFIR